MTERRQLFDEWAGTYDNELAVWGEDFPFGRRDAVVGRVVFEVLQARPHVVADLGCGTGVVLARLAAADPGLTLWGVDFSPAMLSKAREAVPQAQFMEADLTDPRLVAELPALDGAASAYVLHELRDEQKVALIAGLLCGPVRQDGVVVVGDIGFRDEASLEAVRTDQPFWDDNEYPWVAGRMLPLLEGAGVAARWEQLGPFAGVLVAMRPATTYTGSMGGT